MSLLGQPPRRVVIGLVLRTTLSSKELRGHQHNR
ncbi:DUF2767 family protein [Desulfosediminicola flagellatus]